mmetsp:Transcript_28578/g.72821  ORF Transcript_28578/g.72821 Transcript_28578/m.72821 type:complete len:107 (+) Transcript_28578:2524-2844(+)
MCASVRCASNNANTVENTALATTISGSAVSRQQKAEQSRAHCDAVATTLHVHTCTLGWDCFAPKRYTDTHQPTTKKARRGNTYIPLLSPTLDSTFSMIRLKPPSSG